MTFDEYNTLAATATADNFQAVINSIMAEIKTDAEQLASAMELATTQEQRIRDLQDTNQKLFLSQTAPMNKPADDGDDVECEGILALDLMAQKIKGDDPEKQGLALLMH